MEKAGADPVEEEARVKEAAKEKAAAKESMEAAVAVAMVDPWVAMEWEVEVVCPRQAWSSFSMTRKALVSSLNMMAALMSFATAGL